MSIFNLLKSCAVVLCGALVGYQSIKLFNEPSEQNRGLASVTYSKLGSQQFSKTLFDIQVKNDSIATNSDETSKVKVTVEAYKAFPAGLEYVWTLPENAKLVSGQLQGDLLDFAAHQKKEFEIEVKGYSKEMRSYISFAVKGSLENTLIERDILVSSRPEDSFEFIVQQKEKNRAAAAAQNKLLNKLVTPEAKSPIDLNKVSF